MANNRLYYALLIVGLIHFLLFQLPLVIVKEEKILTRKKSAPIRLKIVQRKRLQEQKVDRKKVSNPTKDDPSRISSLNFSQLRHQLKTTTSKTKTILKKEDLSEGFNRGRGNGNCLTNILDTVGQYPRSFFHHQIEGYSEVQIQFINQKDRPQISLSSVDTSHALVEKYFCYSLKKAFAQYKDGKCLEKYFDKQKKISYRLQFSMGQKVDSSFLSLGGSRFLKRVISLPKKSALRGLMAVANVFTLLELHETETDEREWIFYNQTLGNFNCKEVIL